MSWHDITGTPQHDTTSCQAASPAISAWRYETNASAANIEVAEGHLDDCIHCKRDQCHSASFTIQIPGHDPILVQRMKNYFGWR